MTFTGRRGTALLILNLGICDVGWSTSHLGRFTPVKELGYSSNRSLGGSQNRSVRSEDGEDHLPAPRLEIRTVQPVEVATPTSLFQYSRDLVFNTIPLYSGGPDF